MSDHLETLYTEHLDLLCQRFDAAMEAEGLDAVVLPSGTPKTQFLDDMDYPFKVNPHFKTWVPLTQAPHCWVVKKRGQRPHLIFYSAKDFWHKPNAWQEDFWTKGFDVTVVHDVQSAMDALPEDSSRAALIGEWHDRWQQRLGQLEVNPERLIHRLHFARQWKSDYEIECMRQANLRAAAGHMAAAEAFREGESELGIHLAYLKAAGHAEHELPYGNIVALNENGAVLHYQYQEAEKPSSVRSFLIDAGAQCRGYAADITRSYAVAGSAFADAIAAFDELQQRLVAAIRPGLAYPDLHLQAHRAIASWLVQFGYLSGSPDALVELGITQTFFPHGLGHFIGLQVHDVAGKQASAEGEPLPQPPAHPFLRLLHQLQPGHVLTVEPGVYFIPVLLEPWREHQHGKLFNWSRIEEGIAHGGIRIEDDVVVTESGSDNLTRWAFAQLS
jgi:Xaa-Pro dipeptidase